MNIKGLVRKFINGTDDDYIESEEQEYEDDFDFAPDQSPLPEPQIHPVHSRSEKPPAGMLSISILQRTPRVRSSPTSFSKR